MDGSGRIRLRGRRKQGGGETTQTNRFPMRRKKIRKRANAGDRKRWATGAANNGKWMGGEDWTGEARRRSERGAQHHRDMANWFSDDVENAAGCDGAAEKWTLRAVIVSARASSKKTVFVIVLIILTDYKRFPKCATPHCFPPAIELSRTLELPRTLELSRTRER